MEARRGLNRKEQKDVENLRAVRAPVVYETIRQEGEDELRRPAISLWWSGVAAGLAISAHFAEKDFLELLLLGIPAGFLIAALAWMLPSAEGSPFWVILLVTYIIALGEFAHVVAGSVEVFLLVIADRLFVASALVFVIFPTLISNILGGTALFSLIAYGQVRAEI